MPLADAKVWTAPEKGMCLLERPCKASWGVQARVARVGAYAASLFGAARTRVKSSQVLDASSNAAAAPVVLSPATWPRDVATAPR